MDKHFAYLILVGLAVGALMGMGVGVANGNAQLGIGGGAVIGVFVGWFAAVAATERAKSK